MPPSGAERWFHTLVVVGAALGGCGGNTTEDGHPVTSPTGVGGSNTGGGGSTTATSGSNAVGPEACTADAQFVCQDYATRSACRCDVTRPLNPSSCQSPLDFECTELPCPPNQFCTQRFVDCRCDSAALHPEDCQMPEQFFCATTYPHFRDCACRPGPAVDPAVCPKSYCCQSNDPRFGCDCSCTPIK